jgi:hypothetical protein
LTHSGSFGYGLYFSVPAYIIPQCYVKVKSFCLRLDKRLDGESTLYLLRFERLLRFGVMLRFGRVFAGWVWNVMEWAGLRVIEMGQCYSKVMVIKRQT